MSVNVANYVISLFGHFFIHLKNDLTGLS